MRERKKQTETESESFNNEFRNEHKGPPLEKCAPDFNTFPSMRRLPYTNHECSENKSAKSTLKTSAVRKNLDKKKRLDLHCFVNFQLKWLSRLLL